MLATIRLKPFAVNGSGCYLLSEIAVKERIDRATFQSVGRHEQAHGWQLGSQVHPFHELIVLFSGSQRARVHGTTYLAEAGDALIYPAGVSHEEWSEPGVKLASVFMQFEWSALPDAAPILFSDERGRLRTMAEWLHAEREPRLTTSAAVTQTVLRAIVAECLVLWHNPSSNLATRVHHYVEANIARPITLDALARHVGMSRYHFIRKYRALTGHTPMADVTRQRVERARDLILSTSLPLKAIPPLVGLSDVYRMGRLFRQHLGLTPGSLRRKAKP